MHNHQPPATAGVARLTALPPSPPRARTSARPAGLHLREAAGRRGPRPSRSSGPGASPPSSESRASADARRNADRNPYALSSAAPRRSTSVGCAGPPAAPADAPTGSPRSASNGLRRAHETRSPPPRDQETPAGNGGAPPPAP